MTTGYVYLISNKPNGILYCGVTSDLEKRICQHKAGSFDGFSKRYNLTRLVWFEKFTDIRDAIAQEKCIKEWKRAWKIRLIEESNPDWKSLSL